ncbi:Insulinase [Hexamita inflata]|uniref:Insulinase n=2 Tax=Hexamita inflata TaxID=28002 RepID=A0ABP1K283_9EUKA
MNQTDFVNYFRSLIKQYYEPQIQIEMVPVTNQTDVKNEQENKELSEMLKTLSKEQVDKIISDQQKIENRQKIPNDPEELKKIGKLNESDLQNIGEQIKKLEGFQIEVHPFSYYEFDTNIPTICYFKVCFDLSADADTQTISYASLASRILTRVRTQKHSSLSSLQDQIENVTGSVQSNTQINDTNSGARVLLIVKSKFLVEYAQQACDLLADVVSSSINYLTNEHLSEIIDEYYNELNDNLTTSSGYELAFNRAMAQYSSAAASVDYTEGLQMLKFLNSGPKLERLQEMFTRISQSAPILFCVGTHKAQFQLMEQKIASSFANFKPKPHQSRLFKLIPEIRSNLTPMAQKSISAPVNVNYVAVTYDHNHQINSSALMLSDTILSKSYLWDNIRILGGAYGCFLTTSLKMQQYLVSYHDPNINKTFEAYKQIPSYISSLSLTQDELFSFKIGALGQKQKSVAPEQRFNTSLSYFFEGVNVKNYGDLVNGIISVSIEELRKTAEIYQKLVDGNQVVVGKAHEVRQWAKDNEKECEDM